jgi:hypothetical protein
MVFAKRPFAQAVPSTIKESQLRKALRFSRNVVHFIHRFKSPRNNLVVEQCAVARAAATAFDGLKPIAETEL